MEVVVEGDGGGGSVSVVRLMRPGEVFASREMLTRSTHSRTTRAREHVELLALSNVALGAVLRNFPDIHQSVYQYALVKYNYSFQL